MQFQVPEKNFDPNVVTVFKPLTIPLLDQTRQATFQLLCLICSSYVRRTTQIYVTGIEYCN